MIHNAFLGRPSKSIQRWLKAHPPAFEGDIYVLDDGTEVRVSANDPLAQGAIDIGVLPDNLAHDSISMYKYGQAHTGIANLTYRTRDHGIDLSATAIENITQISLDGNNLTALTLPQQLTSFEKVSLNRNKLTSFILPNSLKSFTSLQLGTNWLTSFTVPDSVRSFTNLSLTWNSLTSFKMPDFIESFNYILIHENQLSTLVLPRALMQFGYLYVDNTCDIDCTACTSVPIMLDEIYSRSRHAWTGSVLVRDEAQKAAFESNSKWGKYKIQVK